MLRYLHTFIKLVLLRDHERILLTVDLTLSEGLV